MKKIENAPMVIYDFICDFIEKNSYPPTVREICASVGLSSPATVHYHLNTLMQRGLIAKDPQKQRAYIVCNARSHIKDSIPLLGNVAAGIPITAVENIEDSFPLPRYLTHGLPADETFMLHVCGDSMMDAGILNGDIIVVASGQNVTNGDIVVARIDGEDVTVKRLKLANDKIMLVAENPNYDPIVVAPERLDIIGKVIGLMRPYH